jgi:mRNA-degrading endonuclease RelE of RelBE toxin-antitoxin system
MSYRVKIKKKISRSLRKLPKNVQQIFFLLIEDLKADGPIQKSWKNFSSLSEMRFTAI